MLERTARPLRGIGNLLADGTRAAFRVLGNPGRLLQDLLNGTWLGHSLHAVLVDVVVGAATAALLLDLLRVVFAVEGLETATTWIIGLVALSALGAILTGLTDFKDTSQDTRLRDLVTLHGLVNLLGSVGLLVAFLQRLGDAFDAAFWVFLVSYVVLSTGAYIGGHVVYKHGYMVSYNAHARGKRASDFTSLMPAADLPEGTPTKATFGTTALMLVKRDDVVHALKDTCSHLGGPLSQGELGEDTITCPWHFSVFRLRDGTVVHGPATSRQPAYEARISDGQVEIRGPID